MSTLILIHKDKEDIMDKESKNDLSLSKEEKEIEKRKQYDKKQENALRNENYKKELNSIQWPDRVKKEISQSMQVLSLSDDSLEKWSQIKKCKEKLELLSLVKEVVFKKAYIVQEKNISDVKKVA